MERTNYMQTILNDTYAQCAIIAIQQGTLTGAWERAIREKLRREVANKVSQAEVILQHCKGDYFAAAELIKNSIIPAAKKTDVDRLNTAFDLHKEAFDGLYHTTLWEIIIKNSLKGRTCCFSAFYNANGLQLAIAVVGQKGVIPCPCYFKTQSYKDAMIITDELNEEVFGLTSDQAYEILDITLW